MLNINLTEKNTTNYSTKYCVFNDFWLGFIVFVIRWVWLINQKYGIGKDDGSNKLHVGVFGFFTGIENVRFSTPGLPTYSCAVL
ncbi:Putative membrane protein [Zobellia galactanivorans]|uniref:Putative membrane protein n=1 Tax=Zobellia galactanivorans (strain DSM 12802 / CCUG 47099 / CIP 106680 / NCIMB 13871 / Dsij) TaxID=63186 RepID=G0LAN0_ZOBGA|nr:Putative membrane protein [Zobellia galactanivorans]